MICRIATPFAALFFAGAALAQDVPDNPLCEVKGENGMVTLLLCPAGLEASALAGEGKAACGDRLPCGAWIWTDAADMPSEAPDSHDKLTAAQVTSSQGVWMNELGQLVSISKETQ